MKLKTIQYAFALGLSKGLFLLTEQYVNSKVRMEWLCPEGHIFLSQLNCVHNGHGCSKCNLIRLSKVAEPKRNDVSKLHLAASKKGGKWLGDSYTSCMKKTTWQCGSGHIWEASYNAISRGDWCPYCARPSRVGLSYFTGIAEKHGGKCVNPTEWVNCTTKLEWQCANGHVWKTMPTLIGQGVWCRLCRTSTWGQDQIYSVVKGYFPDAQSNIKGILPNKLFELDIYIPSIKKAIEYDGMGWHSRPETKERDQRKNKECQQAGIDLLRVSSKQFSRKQKEITQKVLDFLGVSHA